MPHIQEHQHGTTTGYAYGCREECCRRARREYIRERHLSIPRGLAPGYSLAVKTPPVAPPVYKQATRDPRMAPVIGDVFEKDGRVREIVSFELDRMRDIIVLFTDSGNFTSTHNEKYTGRCTQMCLRNFRQWAKTANILCAKEPANV